MNCRQMLFTAAWLASRVGDVHIAQCNQNSRWTWMGYGLQAVNETSVRPDVKTNVQRESLAELMRLLKPLLGKGKLIVQLKGGFCLVFDEYQDTDLVEFVLQYG